MYVLNNCFNCYFCVWVLRTPYILRASLVLILLIFFFKIRLLVLFSLFSAAAKPRRWLTTASFSMSAVCLAVSKCFTSFYLRWYFDKSLSNEASLCYWQKVCVSLC